MIWGMDNDSTLRTTISRLLKQEVLYPLQRGLYSVAPPEELNPVEIGLKAIGSFAYLSTESVLAENGIINQAVAGLTFVSSISKKFRLLDKNYFVRQMSSKFLRCYAGIQESDGVFKASAERAAADMLYFSPKYYFDNPRALDWKKVKEIQKEVNY